MNNKIIAFFKRFERKNKFLRLSILSALGFVSNILFAGAGGIVWFWLLELSTSSYEITLGSALLKSTFIIYNTVFLISLSLLLSISIAYLMVNIFE